MDDLQNTRKHFTFLLNYVLDCSKKSFLSADDLVLVSNEVKNFKKYIQKANIDNDLKENWIKSILIIPRLEPTSHLLFSWQF